MKFMTKIKAYRWNKGILQIYKNEPVEDSFENLLKTIFHNRMM